MDIKNNKNLPVRLKGVGDSLWVSINPLLPVERLQNELIKPFELTFRTKKKSFCF